ncbi:MAG TPA: hypothetical protein VFU31_21075 [Candidatus Binatia bacterium]|nr:hypothetical protein [Candidatus Binatia bacterium]
MPTPIVIQIPPLPAGFCLSPVAVHNLLTQITGELPGEFTVWNVGPNEPSVENRSKPWLKIDSSTGVWTGIFSYSPAFGLWLQPHWHNGVPPFNERRLFVGSLTDLETYDGGSPGTVSDVTGPFWERATEFDNKWPLGVGTLIPNVATDAQIFDDAVPGDPKARGVYFIKCTSRLYDRSS